MWSSLQCKTSGSELSWVLPDQTMERLSSQQRYIWVSPLSLRLLGGDAQKGMIQVDTHRKTGTTGLCTVMLKHQWFQLITGEHKVITPQDKFPSMVCCCLVKQVASLISEAGNTRQDSLKKKTKPPATSILIKSLIVRWTEGRSLLKKWWTPWPVLLQA